MTGEVLILGGTGRFGRHVADAFASAGWTVRHFDRKTDDLMTAAQGADVIVNGWNPLYPAWARGVPQLTRDVIAAAKAAKATVILPGNVYVFGSGSGPLLDETTPHKAANPLGRIRIEMEAAYRSSGVRTILLRAGDFIDTAASGNWLDSVILAKAGTGRGLSARHGPRRRGAGRETRSACDLRRCPLPRLHPQHFRAGRPGQPGHGAPAESDPHVLASALRGLSVLGDGPETA